jgi:DNA-binding GntR family transcriptional regulator
MTDGFRLNPVGTGQTLTDRVYLGIKYAILELKFRPGSALVEDDLASQLGTSKTPVRDALLALERDGLVTKIPYKGTYVSEVSMKDAIEIFELRAVLEGLAARLAASVITPAQLAQAVKLLDAADEALGHGDTEAASECGARFHKLLYNLADNGRLKPILEKLEEQLMRLRRMSDQVQGRLEKSSREHRQILAALHSGNPLQAETAMRFHLESVKSDFTLAPLPDTEAVQEASL